MAMRIFLGAMVVVSSMTMSAVAWAQAKQDFTLVNKTGYALSEVYVAPSKSDEWDEDVMGRDIVSDGEAVDISFHRTNTSCKWDLKVVYQDDGSNVVWYDIDLCTVSKITIKYNRKTDTTSASFD